MKAPSFWHRPSGLAHLLAPFGVMYAAGGRLRRRVTRPARVLIPIVCVGNLVAGGAGKTPVARALQVWFAGHGRRVHFLTRGYGGRATGPVLVEPKRHTAAEVGDEPLLLAESAPTWVARDRAGGAEAAAMAGADVVVMDDGFQNPTLYKDLSLVVIDGEYGFGNGLVIPAGPLREPVADGLKRADAVVLVGPDGAGVEAGLPSDLAVLHAELRPVEDDHPLTRHAVVAFAGIGRPEKFFSMLRTMGCRIISTHAYPDHYPYREDEIGRIIEEARHANAVPVTTAKDAARLPSGFGSAIEVLDVRLEWRDEAALERVLAPVMRQRGGLDG